MVEYSVVMSFIDISSASVVNQLIEKGAWINRILNIAHKEKVPETTPKRYFQDLSLPRV